MAYANSVDSSKAAKKKASERYEGLTPMEGALLDLQSDSNDRVIQALERLEEKVPSPRVILASAGSLMLGVMVLVVYVVSIVAVKGGVDVGQAASATESVVTVATEATTPALPPVEATPVEAQAPTAAEPPQ
jgi:hypothetical protein